VIELSGGGEHDLVISSLRDGYTLPDFVNDLTLAGNAGGRLWQ